MAQRTRALVLHAGAPGSIPSIAWSPRAPPGGLERIQALLGVVGGGVEMIVFASIHIENVLEGYVGKQ